MGENTKIEWTDHTFNPWWGCARVSPGCEHCYAETFAGRFGVQWGVRAERKPASESYWRKPLAWNTAAQKAGIRARVFCASMADVFEDRRDLDELRVRLFRVIESTPWLDWQLLTKRPDAVMRLVPEAWRIGFPRNVWLGATVEDQKRAEQRIEPLLRVPAAVHFLSCEPLLGYVDISIWTHRPCGWSGCGSCGWRPDLPFIDWVIAGGESGANARPMHPAWARNLRDACARDGVPFLFKQWGEFEPSTESGVLVPDISWDLALIQRLGVKAPRIDEANMVRVGKKAAGRLLDGREHNGFPVICAEVGR